MALEYIQVAEAVAKEKGISKEVILDAMEQAFQMAGRRKFGMSLNIQAILDRNDGTVVLKQLKEVTEKVLEPVSKDELRNASREDRDPVMVPSLDAEGKPVKENDNYILYSIAKKDNPDIQIGEFISYELPKLDFGRIAAQAARQVITQKVKDAERDKEFNLFESSEGQIITGIVKKVDFRGVLLDLGSAEAFMPKEEMISREMYKPNDRIRAYVYKVERQARGAQIFVSRTHNEFLAKLFKEEVPEIENGTIEVMAVARDAGFRAKIAVKSNDGNLDPVGACVGIRGSRVNVITQELQGERIDIINWSHDPAVFLVRALAPAEVSKVVLDEEEGKIEVVVAEDKLSLAIGRRGQNVRLASALTGWSIDIMSEEEEKERRLKESEKASKHFIEALDVDEPLAQLLISEGFTDVMELTYVELPELAQIEGFNEEIATEIQSRANAFVNSKLEEAKKLGAEQDLIDLEGMKVEFLPALAKAGVKTMDDLAELGTDELLEILPENLLKKDAEDLIMTARKNWFE